MIQIKLIKRDCVLCWNNRQISFMLEEIMFSGSVYLNNIHECHSAEFHFFSLEIAGVGV